MPGPVHKDLPVPSFDLLHLDTPMILLNFGPLDYLAHRVPTDGSRHYSYLKVTHGVTPSFFIMTGLMDK